MTIDNSRRTALVGLGALAVGSAALAAGPSRAATTERIVPPGAREFSELMERLRRPPRRRDFKTVPMILQQTPGIVATIPELQQVGFHYAA